MHPNATVYPDCTLIHIQFQTLRNQHKNLVWSMGMPPEKSSQGSPTSVIFPQNDVFVVQAYKVKSMRLKVITKYKLQTKETSDL